MGFSKVFEISISSVFVIITVSNIWNKEPGHKQGILDRVRLWISAGGLQTYIRLHIERSHAYKVQPTQRNSNLVVTHDCPLCSFTNLDRNNAKQHMITRHPEIMKQFENRTSFSHHNLNDCGAKITEVIDLENDADNDRNITPEVSREKLLDIIREPQSANSSKVDDCHFAKLGRNKRNFRSSKANGKHSQENPSKNFKYSKVLIY